MRRLLTLILVLFAIPAIGLATGVGLRSSMDEAFSPAVNLEEAGARPMAGPPTLADVCPADRTGTLQARCREYQILGWLIDASVALAVAGGVLLLGIPLAVRAVGGSRTALARVFRPGFVIVLVAVAAMVAVQGVVAGFAALLVEAGAAVRGHTYFFGLIPLGGLIGAVHILRSGFTLAQPLCTVVAGEWVSRERAPRLWALIDDVARRSGARPPQHLVVGLQPTFFVAAGEVDLAGLNTALLGETMFLSLPLMRVLDKTELAAVIGHELGHFRGEDSAYSLHFVPIYRGLNEALRRLDRLDTGASSIALIPGIAVLSFFLEQFAVAERQIGRAREIAADRNGAAVTSPTALVSALVKCAAFAPLWDDLTAIAVDALEKGRPSSNLSARFTQLAADHARRHPPAALIAAIAASRQPHPTDTHPPLLERAQALGIALDSSWPGLDLPDEDAAEVLMGDAEAEEWVLTDLEHHRLATSGMAALREPTAA